MSDIADTDNKKVAPRQPGGYQDYLPARMLARQQILDKVRAVYEGFGFVPLQTSIVQYREVLTGGQPSGMQIFSVKGSGSEEQSLRFDLTVPLARTVAESWDDIPHPFKRYELGNVFRGEKRQRGRYNEFAQFDVDTVGSSSMLADAEIILMITVAMREIGVDRFKVRVNNRKLLNAIPAYAGFSGDLRNDVFRLLDKVDKIGLDGVLKALGSETVTDEEGNVIEGLGLSADAVAKIRAFLEVRAANNGEMLEKLKTMLGGVPEGAEGIAELEEILGYLEGQTDCVVLDPSVVRGLGYYSGPVFETTLDDLPTIGSVCSGGRYDGLVSRFSDLKAPAVGMSIGVDRFIAAMEELGMLKARKSTAQVCILRFFDKNDQEVNRKLARYALDVAQRLRGADINTEVYLGEEITMKGQLAYALNQDIPVVLIVGPDEMAKGTVMVKNTVARTQAPAALDDLIQAVQAAIGTLEN